MCKARCILAFLALSINLAYSWDIAVTDGDQIYYNNETKTNSEGLRFRDLRALAYDAVHNMLLFVDKNNDNASIFSYHLASNTYQPLVRRKSSQENIQGIAYDPVESVLFWTDNGDRSIYWKSLKKNAKNDEYGSLLIKMDDEKPRGIAIDSCRGYVYWTNMNSKPTIERARFDGSERKVIVNTDIYMPVSIAVDQRSGKLYWADDREGINYSIESSDLDGKNRKTILKATGHQPNTITVSKDYIYWVGIGPDPVWRLPKNGSSQPDKVQFNEDLTRPFAIVANYKVSDQIEESKNCKNMADLALVETKVIEPISIREDVGLFCLHGIKEQGVNKCNCSLGYTGDRCEISLSQNYCFHGDFSLTADGAPQCRCKPGYTGVRCQVDQCYGHCLNNGVCSVTDNNELACKCPADFEGPRCEAAKSVATTDVPKDTCNCSRIPAMVTMAKSDIDGEFVEGSGEGWDYIRDPILMVLGILCGLLCLTCAVLVTKIMHLKKRPRIKKRIIVNKNVTPLTARPDQCEITIENCCNMNICETPCFEPRSTIRPTLLDAKPGKEEKRNLIANMEHPDDF